MCLLVCVIDRGCMSLLHTIFFFFRKLPNNVCKASSLFLEQSYMNLKCHWRKTINSGRRGREREPFKEVSKFEWQSLHFTRAFLPIIHLSYWNQYDIFEHKFSQDIFLMKTSQYIIINFHYILRVILLSELAYFLNFFRYLSSDSLYCYKENKDSRRRRNEECSLTSLEKVHIVNQIWE